nr:antibiotic biosynthesis monooxygenase [uncultured Chryseobacterium sp.]
MPNGRSKKENWIQSYRSCRKLRKKSSREIGNLFYKIHQSQTDRNTLILFEGYEDETALEFHRNSEHYQNLVVKEVVPLLENREFLIMDQII